MAPELEHHQAEFDMVRYDTSAYCLLVLLLGTWWASQGISRYSYWPSGSHFWWRSWTPQAACPRPWHFWHGHGRPKPKGPFQWRVSRDVAFKATGLRRDSRFLITPRLRTVGVWFLVALSEKEGIYWYPQIAPEIPFQNISKHQKNSPELPEMGQKDPTKPWDCRRSSHPHWYRWTRWGTRDSRRCCCPAAPLLWLPWQHQWAADHRSVVLRKRSTWVAPNSNGNSIILAGGNASNGFLTLLPILIHGLKRNLSHLRCTTFSHTPILPCNSQHKTAPPGPRTIHARSTTYAVIWAGRCTPFSDPFGGFHQCGYPK